MGIHTQSPCRGPPVHDRMARTPHLSPLPIWCSRRKTAARRTCVGNQRNALPRARGGTLPGRGMFEGGWGRSAAIIEALKRQCRRSQLGQMRTLRCAPSVPTAVPNPCTRTRALHEAHTLSYRVSFHLSLLSLFFLLFLLLTLE